MFDVAGSVRWKPAIGSSAAGALGGRFGPHIPPGTTGGTQGLSNARELTLVLARRAAQNSARVPSIPSARPTAGGAKA